MKRTVFISHSSKDKKIGEAVCHFLETQGISCWIAPRDVTPGKNYGAAIVDAIDECDVFVLVLSDQSNKSGQVVREVERAASTNSVLIPLRVEPVQPSRDLEFYVSSSHWLDATEKPLERHLGALVDAIRNWQTTSSPRERTPAQVPSSSPLPARQSRPTLMIGGAVVALVLCASVVFLAMRSASSRRGGAPPSVAPASTPQSNPSGSPPSESVAPATMPTIERVIASSALKPQMYLGALKSYGANLAFDGDEATAWVPNGGGPGEWIKVFFKSPTILTSISVYGGYGVDFARYATNNRVRQLRVTFPNGFSRVLSLVDKMQLQRFDFPHHPVANSVKFEIVSVYPGTKYDSTPISEILFNQPAAP